MKDRRPIRMRLSEFYSEDEIEKWMTMPHPQLELQAPSEIYTPKGIEKIHQIIDRLDADGYL